MPSCFGFAGGGGAAGALGLDGAFTGAVVFASTLVVDAGVALADAVGGGLGATGSALATTEAVATEALGPGAIAAGARLTGALAEPSAVVVVGFAPVRFATRTRRTVRPIAPTAKNVMPP